MATVLKMSHKPTLSVYTELTPNPKGSTHLGRAHTAFRVVARNFVGHLQKQRNALLVKNETRKNKSKKHRKNLSGSYHKGYSHTYNSGIILSRLQRIYHTLNATYYPLK